MISSSLHVNDVAKAIASALADDRVRRHNEDLPSPSTDEERQLARATASYVLAQSRSTDSWGFDALPGQEDRLIIEQAIAQVLGLGRLEPLLEDDDISDIHVRGNRPVWVKMRSGERRESRSRYCQDMLPESSLLQLRRLPA